MAANCLEEDTIGSDLQRDCAWTPGRSRSHRSIKHLMVGGTELQPILLIGLRPMSVIEVYTYCRSPFDGTKSLTKRAS
jgi:hypothetical protein